MAESAKAASYYSEVEGFIETLFGEGEGFIYTPTKDPATGRWRTYFFTYPEQKGDAVSHILDATNSKEVYLAPSLFKKPQATKAAWKGTNYVWVEFDGNSPDSLPDGIPEPSIRIQSSTKGHEHWYWKLDSFESDKNVVEGLSKRLAYTLESDRSGWDAVQVLRPPGTMHHDSKRRVRLQKVNSSTHSISDFLNLVDAPDDVVVNTNITNLPDIQDVISKYKFPGEAYDLFKKPIQKHGSRSSAMMKMGFHCIEMGMTDEESYVILLNCDDRWGKFKNRTPESRSKRLLGIIARAKQQIGIKVEKKLTEIRPYYSFKELRELDLGDVGWWLDDLYVTQTLGFAAGDAGVGKSSIMLQMCMDLTCGKDFLGWKNLKGPAKTGYFSFEMTIKETQGFSIPIFEGYNEDQRQLIDEFFHLDAYGSTEILNKKGINPRQAILDKIDSQGTEFVVFDSLRAVTALDDKNIEEFLDWVDKDLRRERGCSVWVIHHNRKPGKGEDRKEQSLADLYGSVTIGAVASTVIGLELLATGATKVNSLKTRMAKPFDSFTIRRTEHLSFEKFKEEPKKVKLSDIAADSSAIDGPGKNM